MRTSRDTHQFNLPRADYTSVVSNATLRAHRHITISPLAIRDNIVKHKSFIGKFVYFGAVAVLLLSLATQYAFFRPKAHAQTFTTPSHSPTSCTGNTGGGTVNWTNTGGAVTAGDSSRATAVINQSTTHTLLCTGYGFNTTDTIPAQASIISVNVRYIRHASALIATSGNYYAVKGGTLTSAISEIWPATTDSPTTKSGVWGTSWTPADINNNAGFGGALNAFTASSSNQTASVDSIAITVTYSISPTINMTGYVWENDDEDQARGDAYDSNSSQANANTAITGVRKGERLTLREQLQNTSGADLTSDLGLFYDKNGDGNFIKANLPQSVSSSGNGACAAAAWSCSSFDTSSLFGQYSAMAFDSDGIPYVSYYDASGLNLRVAHYVGSGGSGCSLSSWTCTTVDSTGNVGQYTSIAVNSKGVPYVAYYDATNTSLKVAFYDGDNTASGCDASANSWNCKTVFKDNFFGDIDNGTYTSITMSPSDVPYVTSYSAYWGALDIAYDDGTGGGCTGGTGTWTCDPNGDAIAYTLTGNTGQYSSIAFDPTGSPYVTYYDVSNHTLNYARLGNDVAPGTSCDTTLAASNWFPCSPIDGSVADTGQYTSLAFSPNGTPYVSYYDVTNKNLRVAFYDGDSTSSGCGTSAIQLQWTCTTVEANSSAGGTNDIGKFSSLAFSPSGTPYISYYDASNTSLRLARFVGGGAQSSCAGGSSDWACMDIDTANDVGQYSSLAFDDNGTPYISYLDASSSNIRIANLNRIGEISLTPPLGGGNGDAIATAKIGGSCAGGSIFTNGKLFAQETGNTISLPSGDCTEVAFTIDTSQAVAGVTYRFVIATNDSMRQDRGMWRGPNSISQYPTLTIASDTDFKASKGAEPQGSSGCALATWTCDMIVDDNNSSLSSYDSNLAFSPSGVPYITYIGSDTFVHVAQYVGSSGSNCAAGVTAWTCTLITTDSRYYLTSSIAFTPAGRPYISYATTSDKVAIAQYVGGGTGTGCTGGSNDWTCTIIDDSGGSGSTNRIGRLALSPSGVPYIAYPAPGSNALRLAQYVGSGGGGCSVATTTWTCITVHGSINIGSSGDKIDMAFSPSGVPYITYTVAPSSFANLWVAQYVGAGGTGCTNGSTAWTCTAIRSTSTTQRQPSIVFSPSGVPYISFYISAGGTPGLYIAQYVGGTGGTGCTGGSTAWTCSVISTATSGAPRATLAFSPSGVLYVAYIGSSSNQLSLAHSVTAGTGTGCTGSTNWTCQVVKTVSGSNNLNSPFITFSSQGDPYISYNDDTDGYLHIAKTTLYDGQPIFQAVNTTFVRNARLGFGQYRLSDGRSPRTNTNGLCGSSVADNMGICALYNDGGLMDSITANTSERPYFNFAQRFDSNTILPTAAWAGRSNVAPSTAGSAGDIVLQVYNLSTATWQTVATNSSSTNCNTDNCYLSGIPSGTVSNYFDLDPDATHYWMYWRVYQTENTSGSETLKTDLFQLQFINKQMRHGAMFENNVRRNFTF